MQFHSFIILLIILGLVALAFYISARMTRRAVSRVVQIFRDHHATGIQQAKTIEELGLKPPSLLERVSRPRDYKQNALKILIRGEIILMTEEGKLYIPEAKIREMERRGLVTPEG
jgi:hypothetical protein